MAAPQSDSTPTVACLTEFPLRQSRDGSQSASFVRVTVAVVLRAEGLRTLQHGHVGTEAPARGASAAGAASQLAIPPARGIQPASGTRPGMTNPAGAPFTQAN